MILCVFENPVTVASCSSSKITIFICRSAYFARYLPHLLPLDIHVVDVSDYIDGAGDNGWG